MRSLALLLAGLTVSACATSPSLPEADDPTDRGVRAVWATVQTAVRDADPEPIEALADPDPGPVDPGAVVDVGELIVEATASDADLRRTVLATRAFELERRGTDRWAFVYTPASGPQPDGFEIVLRRADSGEVYVSTASFIG